VQAEYIWQYSGDWEGWVSIHPSLSACMREIAVAGCLSILCFKQIVSLIPGSLCWMTASSKSFVKDFTTSTPWSDGVIALCWS
jgi:tetrahydromethanopterin S-methyltransferase subunit C